MPIASVNTTISVNALLLAQHAGREAQILREVREQLAARPADGDGRRHVRLAQRAQALGQIRGLAELRAHERERGGLVEAFRAKLRVALLEVLAKAPRRSPLRGRRQAARLASRASISCVQLGMADYSTLRVSMGSIVAARRAGR